MASPPPTTTTTTASSSSPAATTTAAAAAAAAAHPIPKPFFTSFRRPSPSPPPPPLLFTGRPLNPNPNPNPHGILYPVSHHHHLRRAPSPTAGGYVRGVMSPGPPPQPPPQPQGRSFPPFPGAEHHHPVVRPVSAPPRQAAPAAASPAVASQPKVNTTATAAPSNDYSNLKERERNKDETTVVINDRKVRLLDSESGSLYALCRSWVRNGLPHESQPNFGSGEPLLPRPLPASVVDSRMAEQGEDTTEDEDAADREPVNHDYSQYGLLAAHVKRAKKIRARLQKERLRRIERYKQRLALLLPPPSELGRHEAFPGN